MALRRQNAIKHQCKTFSGNTWKKRRRDCSEQDPPEEPPERQSFGGAFNDHVPPSEGGTPRPRTASSSCPVRGSRSTGGRVWDSSSRERVAMRRPSRATNQASRAFPIRAHGRPPPPPGKQPGKQVTARQIPPFLLPFSCFFLKKGKAQMASCAPMSHKIAKSGVFRPFDPSGEISPNYLNVSRKGPLEMLCFHPL